MGKEQPALVRVRWGSGWPVLRRVSDLAPRIVGPCVCSACVIFVQVGPARNLSPCLILFPDSELIAQSPEILWATRGSGPGPLVPSRPLEVVLVVPTHVEVQLAGWLPAMLRQLPQQRTCPQCALC